MLRAISHLRSQLHLRPLPRTLPLPTSPPLPPPSQTSPFHSSFSTGTLPLLHKHLNESNEECPGSPPKLFVVQPRLRPEPTLKAKLNEALNLANSLEEQRDGFYDTEFCEKDTPPHVVVQNPAARSIRADTYFGPGTVDMIKCHINALESQGGVDAIFVNAILSGVQQRNLERAWDKPVLDRVGLIIEIFNAHAQTKEAKLQAELAALMYKKTRLVRVRGRDGCYTFGTMGEAEVVSARGRGSGGRGFISGAGETELQLQRRRILDRRNQLLLEIKEVRRTRAVQRAARKRCGSGKGMATVAVVGYTNAGKSTLVSTLSDTDLYCDDRLFATVDPKIRKVVLPSGRKVLLSDTVGFISDLPVQLVEAFHATLEEVVESDLLVHVLDSSAPDLKEQRESVLQVLEQIGVSEQKRQTMIEVWNKIDLQDKCGGDVHCEEDLSFSISDEEEAHVGPDQDVDKSETGGLEEAMGDQLGDFSDGWLSSGDEHDSWVNYDGSSVGQEISDDQQKDLTTDWRIINGLPWKKASANDAESHSESVAHVNTSAVTGVGLQELLKLIDERLISEEVPDGSVNGKRLRVGLSEGSGEVVDNSFFYKKWRAPKSEDTGVAAEG